MESAREEWERRQQKRRQESQALIASAASSGSKKKREEWHTRQKKRARRPKQYKVIASGRVGLPSGQVEVIDLRSPSRSPSIELSSPGNRSNRRGFTLSPDTTLPSISGRTTPDAGINNNRVLSSHPPTTTTTYTLVENEEQTCEQVSEDAVIAHHHLSVSRSPTPHISRDTSQEAVIVHHHRSASALRSSPVSRRTSEEAIIAHHHNSALISPIRQTSEEAIVAHHHMSASMSPTPQAARTVSDATIAAHHQKSVARMRKAQIAHGLSEEAIIKHHHSSALSSHSPHATGDFDGDSFNSEQSMLGYHHLSAERTPPPTAAQTCKSTHDTRHDQHQPSATSSTTSDTAVSLGSSTKNRGISSLLWPFTLPSSNSSPILPVTQVTNARVFESPSPRSMPCQSTQGDKLRENDDTMAAQVDLSSPRTPLQMTDNTTQKSEFPLTPSRLGPTWKTETAPTSEADDNQIDELESDFDDDECPPSLSPFQRFSQQLNARSVSQATPKTQSSPIGSSHLDSLEDELDSNAWAFEYGIDPRQWDDLLVQNPTQTVMEDLDNDDDEDDVEHEESGHDISSEEEDDIEVEAECGYRVFAGYSDAEVQSAPWEDRYDKGTSQTSCTTSLGSLSPRRPTAMEATMGDGWSSRDGQTTASPVLSRGRESAELKSPMHTTPRYTLSSPNAADLGDSIKPLNTPLPNCGASPVSNGSNLPKRDQIILALLHSGEVSLAEHVLRSGLSP